MHTLEEFEDVLRELYKIFCPLHRRISIEYNGVIYRISIFVESSLEGEKEIIGTGFRLKDALEEVELSLEKL